MTSIYRKKQTLRLLFILVVGLVVVLYPVFASIQVAQSRIRLLHELATTKNKYEILVQLGRVYAEGGQYSKAIDCYRKALHLQHDKSNTSLLCSWEDLNSNQPFNAAMHSGFGEMFEHYGQFEQAEMEYRQAIKLSSCDASLKLNLDRVLGKLASNAKKETSRENPSWAAFRKSVATSWSPPNHSDCLVTRCLVFPIAQGSVDVAIVGSSGSFVHDQSAVSFLKSAPILRDVYLNGQIIDCGCMSLGNEKRVACSGLGAFNIVETSLADQCIWQVERWYHDMNKIFGVLSL